MNTSPALTQHSKRPYGYVIGGKLTHHGQEFFLPPGQSAKEIASRTLRGIAMLAYREHDAPRARAATDLAYQLCARFRLKDSMGWARLRPPPPALAPAPAERRVLGGEKRARRRSPRFELES